MQLHVLSKKFVKPVTPTPAILRDYKISFIDELAPSINILALLYYPRCNNFITNQRLEQSLAEILPQFYPLAGRYIKDDHYVDCSDQGAEYTIAQVDCKLHEIIRVGPKGPKPEELNDLLPCHSSATEDADEPLLAIQVTKFACNGLVIAVSMSHRIADASSFGMFVASWANAHRGDDIEAISPCFDSALFFPAKNFSLPPLGEKVKRDVHSLIPSPKIVARRFVFDSNGISRLKAKASEGKSSKRQPSRVQVVSSLITKALVAVDDKTTNGGSRDLLVMHMVSIRERTVPPVPNSCFGNLWAMAMTECSGDEVKKKGFQDFVRLLGDNVTKTVADCTKILADGEDGYKIIIDAFVDFQRKLVNSDINVIMITDWSKLRLYDADFGWGKPVLTSVANVPFKNLVTLIDSKESGGIEAWVHLDEKNMSYFEQDEDIKMFTEKWVEI